MSWIRCKCGEDLYDKTDNIRYKGHILSDKQYFPLLNLADEMIEDTSPDREALAMRFRQNIGGYILFRDVFQCCNCGRLLVEGEDGKFFFFSPEGHENKELFDVETGDKV